MKETVVQLVKLAVLAVLASGIAFLADWKWLNPGRTAPCDPANLPPGHICLATAKETWNDKIVWVDARSQDAFERGTVKARRVVPLRNDSRAQELLAEAMPALHQAGFEQSCIVVFCDRNCSASTEIADKLKTFQLQAPIYILEGGWDEIRKDPELAP